MSALLLLVTVPMTVFVAFWLVAALIYGGWIPVLAITLFIAAVVRWWRRLPVGSTTETDTTPSGLRR